MVVGSLPFQLHPAVLGLIDLPQSRGQVDLQFRVEGEMLLALAANLPAHYGSYFVQN